MDFSTDEKRQYQRHFSLPGFGSKGQDLLKRASVLVIGAGGLGCPVLQYLTAAGVGEIGIVDEDIVEFSNLQRQILYSHEDIGKLKVEVASTKLKQLNPYIKISSFAVRFNASNAKTLLDNFDIVIDGTDNFDSRYLINDACVLFDKVLIYGAINQFNGQVSVFNLQNGPTYRCLFPHPPSGNALPSCSEIGVLGVLPGIIGNFQALEAIKVITGVGEVLNGKVLLYDALNQKSQIVTVNPIQKSREIYQLSDQVTPCPTHSKIKTDPMITEIEPKVFSEMIEKQEDLFVLDVREDWEREVAMIAPSIHIPLGEFSSSSSGPELPSEISRDDNIVIYCKAGVRSRMACEVLQEKGYKKLHNLSGGILKWEADGFPFA